LTVMALHQAEEPLGSNLGGPTMSSPPVPHVSFCGHIQLPYIAFAHLDIGLCPQHVAVLQVAGKCQHTKANVLWEYRYHILSYSTLLPASPTSNITVQLSKNTQG
jgi:hypothetical protein